MYFKVIGKIQGKGRPRFSGKGGFVRTYTPKTTKEYEELIKESYLKENSISNYEGAISIKVIAYFKRRKYDKKQRVATYVLKKPDGDNIVKVVLDALNGIAYNDDKQVSIIELEKLYTDSEERLEIEIKELEG